MPVLADSFAHDTARHAARSAAGRHTAVFALVAGLGVAAAPLAPLLPAAWLWPVVAACGALGVLLAAWTYHRVARLHRTLAGVELSPTGLVVTDAAGRRRAIPWGTVRSVNLVGGGVEVVTLAPPTSRFGRRGAWERLRVGPEWPNADVLARRVVRYAHAHRRTLCVDGVPCDALSLAPLHAALSSGADAA